MSELGLGLMSVGETDQTDSNQTNTRGNAWTNEVIQSLVLSNNRTVRTALIVIASFSLVATSVTVFKILHRAWRSTNPKRDPETYSTKVPQQPLGNNPIATIINSIYPADVLPLALCTAISIQMIIIITIQTSGLGSIWATDCNKTAQVLWPALWLVDFTTLVFSTEMACQLMLKAQFFHRSKYLTPICCFVIVLLVIGVWIPTNLDPTGQTCLASLIWWVTHYAKLGVIIATTLIGAFLALGIIISNRLLRNTRLDEPERIGASRNAVYLLINIITLVLQLPFFIQAVIDQPALATSHLAEIVIVFTGLIHSFAYHFLHTNTQSTTIRPLKSAWSGKKQRWFGDNIDIAELIKAPVPTKGGEVTPDYRHLSSQGNTTRTPSTPPAPETPTTDVERISRPQTSITETFSRPSTAISENIHKKIHSRKTSNYTLFPTESSEPPPLINFYSDNNSIISSAPSSPLMPPAPLFSRSHKRYSSDVSSATVQIGFRLSNLTPSQRVNVPLFSPPPFRGSPLPLMMNTNRRTVEISHPPESPVIGSPASPSASTIRSSIATTLELPIESGNLAHSPAKTEWPSIDSDTESLFIQPQSPTNPQHLHQSPSKDWPLPNPSFKFGDSPKPKLKPQPQESSNPDLPNPPTPYPEKKKEGEEEERQPSPSIPNPQSRPRPPLPKRTMSGLKMHPPSPVVLADSRSRIEHRRIVGGGSGNGGGMVPGYQNGNWI
ncbi:MAG: hypothetical protein M1834_000351 [Cirrosporium novae-zelandiae]|nr:MAG: hypothetical protein M1834_000351 [Cirrosporium novae-zelandiae]